MAFGRLRANVWERNGIKFDTKLKVYTAVVLPAFLYACETWTVYKRHTKIFNHFHLHCLRKLLKIKCQDKIPDTEVMKTAGMQSMHTVLKLAQLRWTGHFIKMSDGRLPKKVFYRYHNYRRENALSVARRNATKTPSKPLWRISTLGNGLIRSDQSGEASVTKEQLSMKERSSVKLKESAENAKPRPVGLQQIL